ncbi:uncharacterized protein LAESUDRAFT_762305 [Laetiporus sulphureus 93-53]|uniref:Uncharacterized protein n=1 Tax=Laetiporus sulphureus 93-53 TaxID=1314785 RepID=A0A165CNA0_9APHY|nr:uncharacterized protein LAESUDRAFT_762305 [Laetiporus sulphureus 93-53]KZT03121.1 hypothetical protein LAESUDRAFT_762305 [Laetiporus sulphureus 93-53]
MASHASGLMTGCGAEGEQAVMSHSTNAGSLPDDSHMAALDDGSEHSIADSNVDLLEELPSAVDPGSLADPLNRALPNMPLPDSAVHSSTAVNDDNFTDEFDDTLCAPQIEELRIATDFKCLLADASWENSDLDKDTIHHLQHPLEEPLSIDEDPDLLYFIELNLTVRSASQCVYESMHQAGLR